MRRRCPTSALTVDGKPGVKVSFSKFDMSNINNPEAMKPVATRVEPDIDAAAHAASRLKQPTCSRSSFAMKATLTAPETGDYNLGMKASGFFRVKLDGKNVTSAFDGDP